MLDNYSPDVFGVSHGVIVDVSLLSILILFAGIGDTESNIISVLTPPTLPAILAVCDSIVAP